MKKVDLDTLPPGTHRVAPNLFLSVRNETSKSWLFRARWNGSTVRIGLGSYFRVPLATVKAKAAKLQAEVAEGRDPRLLYTDKPKETEKPEKKVLTFAEVAKMAIEEKAAVSRWKNAKHTWQWTASVEQYAFPALGKLPIDEISQKDVLKVLRPIWETKTETASRVRGRLETIFNYAIREGLRTAANPAIWKGNLEFKLPARSKVQPVEHLEAPTLPELKRFTAHALVSPKIGNLATLFGILTATRANEFCRASWSQIDMKEKVWAIPAAYRKDGKQYPHRVPLSDLAVHVLELARACARYAERETDAVFFGLRNPFVNLQTPRMMLMRYLDRHLTMHGCRSTFRDWAAETGQNFDATELCLMHEIGNKVTRAYYRTDLLEPRREIMQAWADALKS